MSLAYSGHRKQSSEFSESMSNSSGICKDGQDVSVQGGWGGSLISKHLSWHFLTCCLRRCGGTSWTAGGGAGARATSSSAVAADSFSVSSSSLFSPVSGFSLSKEGSSELTEELQQRGSLTVKMSRGDHTADADRENKIKMKHLKKK